MYYHSFFESGIWAYLTWIICFKIAHKTIIKVLARAEVSFEGLTGERSTSNLHGFWQNSFPQELLETQFLAGCWLEATLSSLTREPLHYDGLLHQST